jgi:hypothetical protein
MKRIFLIILIGSGSAAAPPNVWFIAGDGNSPQELL